MNLIIYLKINGFIKENSEVRSQKSVEEREFYKVIRL
jgi:hypothetical protein